MTRGRRAAERVTTTSPTRPTWSSIAAVASAAGLPGRVFQRLMVGPEKVSPPRVVESFVASLAVDAAHTLNVFSRVQDEISN